VSKIAKAQQEPQLKRMNLNVPLELHNAFKSITASQGENMTDVLMKFIQQYVADSSAAKPKAAAKPKGRRK
jgi:ParG